MIGSTSGAEVIRFKVQETLNEVMHIEASLHKDDWRIREIQREINQLYEQNLRSSCISDDELKALVEKYFRFKSAPDRQFFAMDEAHKIVDGGIKSSGEE